MLILYGDVCWCAETMRDGSRAPQHGRRTAQWCSASARMTLPAWRLALAQSEQGLIEKMVEFKDAWSQRAVTLCNSG